MKNPGLWVVLGVIMLAIVAVLSIIPILGVLALSLITPVLTAGLLYATREADEDARSMCCTCSRVFASGTNAAAVARRHCLRGIRPQRRRRISRRRRLGGDLHDGRQSEMMRGAAAGMLVALLAGLAVQLVVVLALCTPSPLVMFRGVPAGRAMGSSLRANLRNVLPLLRVRRDLPVYHRTGDAAAAARLARVLLPVSAGTLYRSYKDLYEPA